MKLHQEKITSEIEKNPMEHNRILQKMQAERARLSDQINFLAISIVANPVLEIMESVNSEIV
jgi:hypothetical protein